VPLLLQQFPPVRGVGNTGDGVTGVLKPVVGSTGCNTKCPLGSAGEADGVKYQTGNPIVISGNWWVAITGVVVMPDKGKRKGTWMGFKGVCSGGP